MCWEDGGKDKIYVALRSGLVQCFSCAESRFTAECDCSGGDGAFVGIGKHAGTLITCTEKGCLAFWPQSEDKIGRNVGANVARMRANPESPLQVATGGRENDLKLWDGNNLEEPVFEAKNVRNDFLDLRVPVWVTDLGFVPGTAASQPVIAVGTGHKQLRLYDTRAQKRPVYNKEYGKSAITALSCSGDGRYYFIGTAMGDMARIDLRKGEVVNRYLGFAGAVLSIDTYSDDSRHLVAGCGLDRYLRVFNLDPPTTQHQMYVKLQCNCVLFGKTQESAGSCDAITCEHGSLQDAEGKGHSDGDDDEGDDVWATMEAVGDTESTRQPVKKRKTLAKLVSRAKLRRTKRV